MKRLRCLGSSRRRSSGLTLVETMVVLVLASLLGTVIVQGTGFFLGRYTWVKRTQLEASETALCEQWFASTVAAVVPSYVEARHFVGNEAGFEAVTLQPLAAEPGHPAWIRWSISETEPRAVVYTETGVAPWTALRLRAEAVAFQYADSAGRWYSLWPPTPADRHRTPRLVRLTTAEDRTLLLASLDLFPDPVPNYREEF